MKGSLAELETQLEIAYKIGYMEEPVLLRLDETCQALSGKLGRLIKVRSTSVHRHGYCGESGGINQDRIKTGGGQCGQLKINDSVQRRGQKRGDSDAYKKDGHY